MQRENACARLRVQPLEVVRDKLAAISEWTAEQRGRCDSGQRLMNWKLAWVKSGSRCALAVTGAGQSPALDVTVHAIGKFRSIERINKALAFIAERESQQ